MAEIKRRNSRRINVGGVPVGGGAPVTVQSMCTTDTRDVEATVRQVNALAAAGCDIARLAVLDMDAARAVKAIRERTAIPIVADIHFDHRLALECIRSGADKIRINPGNIGGRDNVRAVADAAGEKGVPIRIGVNGGSLEKDLLEKYGHPTAEALCESALRHAALLEDCDFHDICISIKSSSVPLMTEAYRKIASLTDYPLHLGVTEAGTEYAGVVKSSIGIGSLLLDGIGDTIRVSLTADPVREVKAGIELLKALEMKKGPRLTSCPTCGRCQVKNMIEIANQVSARLEGVDRDIHVAVMGCVVNGPGEAREADIGFACGSGSALLFKKGEILRKVDINDAVDELFKEIDAM